MTIRSQIAASFSGTLGRRHLRSTLRNQVDRSIKGELDDAATESLLEALGLYAKSEQHHVFGQQLEEFRKAAPGVFRQKGVSVALAQARETSAEANAELLEQLRASRLALLNRNLSSIKFDLEVPQAPEGDESDGPRERLTAFPSIFHVLLLLVFWIGDTLGLFQIVGGSLDNLNASTVPLIGFAVSIGIAMVVAGEATGVILAKLSTRSEGWSKWILVGTGLIGTSVLTGAAIAAGVTRSGIVNGLSSGAEFTFNGVTFGLLQGVVVLGAALTAFLFWDETEQQIADLRQGMEAAVAAEAVIAERKLKALTKNMKSFHPAAKQMETQLVKGAQEFGKSVGEMDGLSASLLAEREALDQDLKALRARYLAYSALAVSHPQAGAGHDRDERLHAAEEVDAEPFNEFVRRLDSVATRMRPRDAGENE